MTDKAILAEMVRLAEAIKAAEEAAIAYADEHGLKFEIDAADGNLSATYFGEKHPYRADDFDPDAVDEDDDEDEMAWAAHDIQDGNGWYSSWFSR